MTEKSSSNLSTLGSLKACDENHWLNLNNNNFYEKLDIKTFQNIATRAGLSSGCDINLIMPYIKHAKSLLEVGAGYGRVISSLLNNGFTGEITAIERSQHLFQYLEERFKNIRLIQDDIQTTSCLNESFDVILLLWSGIADFSREEQPGVIKRLGGMLRENGLLIVDTMPMQVKPLKTKQFAPQSFSTQLGNTIVRTYEASYNEICSYATTVGLMNQLLLRCDTATFRKRWLYLLS